MGIKRGRAVTRTAARNLSTAATNARTAARLAITSADVIERRVRGPATPQEGMRMVVEKVLAAQAAWWGAGTALAAAGPRFIRAAAIGRGPFGLWEAAIATAVETSAALLNVQRAAMIPLSSAVGANSKRLAKLSR